ncbi:hypothetical protein [Rhizobium sp. GR12]|uniref:hypothetical protein n=1 Tax=Rhizobium sp. GR12 TaxID=3053925 RepID=UPI002FBDD3B6
MENGSRTERQMPVARKKEIRLIGENASQNQPNPRKNRQVEVFCPWSSFIGETHQEAVHAASCHTVFEFMFGIAQSGIQGDIVYLLPALMQQIFSDDGAEASGELTLRPLSTVSPRSPAPSPSAFQMR